MSSIKRLIQTRFPLFAFSLCLFIASVFLILAFFRTPLISSNYYQKSIKQLRAKSESIKDEFTQIMDEIAEKRIAISHSGIPSERAELFSFMQKICGNPQTKGLAYFTQFGQLVLWVGQVIDLQSFFNEDIYNFTERNTSLLVRDKASVFIIQIQKTNRDDYIVFYRLLAFLPQFKAPYLKEYHFISEKMQKNCSIDYWDFREDVSGFDKIFAKHKDEYIGQPRLQDEIQTIFFPLRNENNNIIATVTLSSPSRPSRLSQHKENFLLGFYIVFGISLIFLLIHLMKTSSQAKSNKIWLGGLIILTLMGLRLLFFPLSQLEKIQSLSIFSPANASFISIWNLTKSPADIFLSSLFLFLILGYLAVFFPRLLNSNATQPSLLKSLLVNILFITLSLFFMWCFSQFLIRSVFNSSINLLRMSTHLSFFLLHFSIFLLFFILILVCYRGIKIAAAVSRGIQIPLAIFMLELGLYFLFFTKDLPLLVFFLQAAILTLIIILAFLPKLTSQKAFLSLTFMLSTLLIYTQIHYTHSEKSRSLLQNTLKNTIEFQETWGIFLLEQSMQEIEKREDAIKSLLRNPKPSDLANTLWERTLIAKFNWYSSIDIFSNTESGLTEVSNFSLNMPEPYKPDLDLPLTPEWDLLHQDVVYLGTEKHLHIAYKDWMEEDIHLGRMVIFLLLDYDMLPFLHSANPYFNLLKTTSFPSLSQLSFGFTVFDMEGKLVFNPNKISSGIPDDLLQNIKSSEDSIWSTFNDKGKSYSSLYFLDNNKIYSLFLKKKSFLNHATSLLEMFFMYFICLLFIILISRYASKETQWKNPFWSFSNRVYIAFVAIALIPLIVFSFSTRSFFSQVFTQKITEEAEEHATFAQRVLEDFIFLQQEEQISLTIPPDNIVVWISSAISNDVNLYMDGKLASSSHREFFDYGLLPELIDGEIFYQIQYENNPFYAQSQSIGEYSFHTLTVPYSFQESLLLISLPFPLGQQEIAQTTVDLLEFLFFLSCLFIIVVLLFARVIGGMIINPIQKLLTGTKEVSLGNLEISVQHKHQDEMKTLIDGFNTMVKSLKRHQQELADLSKKVAWAEMARKVAHEIKNPLTPIQLSAEHLLKVYEDKRDNFEEALQESTSYIVSEVENLRRIAQQFLDTSKEASLQKENLNLREILQETLEPYKKLLENRIQFHEIYEEGGSFDFCGDRAKIKIVLRNIITNAIESIREKGYIESKMSSTNSQLMLEIKDTGIGIEEEVLERIFESYFSTKDAGTGLGLPIAKKIIGDHKGTIQALPNQPHGIHIIITLPRE